MSHPSLPVFALFFIHLACTPSSPATFQHRERARMMSGDMSAPYLVRWQLMLCLACLAFNSVIVQRLFTLSSSSSGWPSGCADMRLSSARLGLPFVGWLTDPCVPTHAPMSALSLRLARRVLRAVPQRCRRCGATRHSKLSLRTQSTCPLLSGTPPTLPGVPHGAVGAAGCASGSSAWLGAS